MPERLIDAYTISPDEIQPGDVMCFVVKAMVMRRDDKGRLRYRIYRCPWQGKSIEQVPQGPSIVNMEEVCEALFFGLAQVGIPD